MSVRWCANAWKIKLIFVISKWTEVLSLGNMNDIDFGVCSNVFWPESPLDSASHAQTNKSNKEIIKISLSSEQRSNYRYQQDMVAFLP